jgi:hypothetical protein
MAADSKILDFDTSTKGLLSGHNFDPFGITEINPTKQNGRKWFNKWGKNTFTHSYVSGESDSNDDEVHYHGTNGSFTIFGKFDAKAGQMEMHGKTPRIYIRSNNKRGYNENLGLKKWNSCEITVYTYLNDYVGTSYGTGITAGCFTNHIPDYYLPFNLGDFSSQCYYGKLYGKSGACCFKKEVGFPNTITLGKTTRPFNGRDMPLQKWIGYKFVCRTYTKSVKCNLQMYMDMTEGKNGGDWSLINEIDDTQGLSSYDEKGNPTPVCAPSYDISGTNPPGTNGWFWLGQPLCHQYQTANFSVLLRNDGTTNQYFKWFSVREVDEIVG